jgi:hypothetical protein
MWTCNVDVEVLSRLVYGGLHISKEAHIVCTPTGLNIALINAAAVVYGNITIPVTVEGDTGVMPFDLMKLAMALPQTGTVKLSYSDCILTMTTGRSRYRFYQFAQGAVRDPPPNLMKDLPNVIRGISPKEFYEVNNKILKMSEIDGSLYKTCISVADGVCTVSDRDENIMADLTCETDAPSGHVTVSTGYLDSILMFMKKYIGDPIYIQMYTPESPLTVRYEGDKGTVYYAVAPIVDVEDK